MPGRPSRPTARRTPIAALAVLALLVRMIVPVPLAPSTDVAAATLAALFKDAPICHQGGAADPGETPAPPASHDCALCPACFGGASPLPPLPVLLPAPMVRSGGPAALTPPATGPPAAPRPPFASRAPPPLSV
jgi:hypothetical protein